jgi:hypothetical protein
VVGGGGISGLLLAFLAQNCVSSKLVSSFLKCVQLMGVPIAYLGVWLWLFFKVFFIQKCIKIILFFYKKIIFDIRALK